MSVLHPKIIRCSGTNYRVKAQATLTDEQARNAVRLFRSMNRACKKDKGKTVIIETMFDGDSVGLLG